MILPVCVACDHGGEKDGRSHCGREAVYSSLTRCVQRLALEDYLKMNASEELREAKVA